MTYLTSAKFSGRSTVRAPPKSCGVLVNAHGRGAQYRGKLASAYEAGSVVKKARRCCFGFSFGVYVSVDQVAMGDVVAGRLLGLGGVIRGARKLSSSPPDVHVPMYPASTEDTGRQAAMFAHTQTPSSAVSSCERGTLVRAYVLSSACICVTVLLSHCSHTNM